MRPVGASAPAEPSTTPVRARPQSMSESARSVTPPQLHSPISSAAHHRRAFPQHPAAAAAAAAWQLDARAAEEMRHRLALMALRAEERRRLLRHARLAHCARLAPPVAPPPALPPPACAWSDAELLAATEVTVSAAIDVLQAASGDDGGRATPSPSAGGRAIDAVELERLDSMSRHFLGSSMRRLEARRLIWSRAFPPSSFAGGAMLARK